MMHVLYCTYFIAAIHTRPHQQKDQHALGCLRKLKFEKVVQLAQVRCCFFMDSLSIKGSVHAQSHRKYVARPPL